MKQAMRDLILIAAIIGVSMAVFSACNCNETRANKTDRFKLRTGETVACQIWYSNACGMILKKCSDGNEYYCMNDVMLVK